MKAYGLFSLEFLKSRAEYALLCMYMDGDSINNGQVSMETSLSNYMPMGYFSGTRGQLTDVSGWL